jgi:hypothetical protein
MGMRAPVGMVMIERATGKAVGPAIPFKRGDFSYKVPKLDSRVWHYMDYWKFESLINEGRLYFRRSDRLEDDMEGKYAEANRTYTTKMWRRFCDAYPVHDSAENREAGNEAFRRAVFISCWHLNRVENMTMWERFTKSEDSVVLRTTVRKLLQVLSDPIPNTKKRDLKVVVSKIIYAPQTVPRPEWSNHGPFFYKDTRFMDEREFRLVVHPPENQPIGENDLGQTLSVDPAMLIEQVLTHPRASNEFRNKVRDFLRTNGIRISVSKSFLAAV